MSKTSSSNDSDPTSPDFANLGAPTPHVAPGGSFPGEETTAFGPRSTDLLQDDVRSELEQVFGDRYEMADKLGQGGFGAVFRGFDRRLKRAVAIKVARADRAGTSEAEALMQEAQQIARLRHEGIVTVHDVGLLGQHCFIVSELLDGPNLSEWLRQRRPEWRQAVEIASAVADALAHAHKRSMIHRDIKPSNIILLEGHRPVLVDFGIALSDATATANRGLIAGTPLYMSPEQARGQAHRPDGRTDIYSLGVTLYELLCGRPPFRGEDSTVILQQVREDDPQPPRQLCPDMPVEVERAVLTAMAKKPSDRFTTAADFAAELRRSLYQPPSTLVPAPHSPLSAEIPSTVVPKANQEIVTQLRPSRAPETMGASERRQITVLQCTFHSASESPSDGLGEDLDEAHERFASFRSTFQDIVTEFGGIDLPSLGATFLACFGYPVAREDASRGAVRSALTVMARSPGGTVQATVHSGQAVVTRSPTGALSVVGDVVNALTPLNRICPAGSILVTEPVRRLVEGYFTCEPAGEITLRTSPATALYRIAGERDAHNRVEAADPARLTPLIGRDREVALLRERWERAAEGVRNVILLVADPGLGKSRLIRVVRDHVQQSSGTEVVEWYCSPYHQGSPFYPVIDYFDRSYQLSREPDLGRRLDRLVARLIADGIRDVEEQALLAAMLSIPGGSRLPELSLSPDRQKEKTRDALLAWLTARAATATVLFVVEDLHWVDPSTESLLIQFVEQGGESRVLGLFTFRPEYDPPWKGKAVQTQVALNRLTRSQITEMIRVQSGDATIPQSVIDQIAERTDGVPLFVEEFTRLLMETGRGVEAAIPTTLQDLLLARLDRMASVREVVQLGAVIGRTFSYDVIRAASGLEETVFRAELEKLVGAGLLFAKGNPPRCTYTFKHALIQDAAYQSMVKKQRQQFHRMVAEALERSFPDVVETQPELLAHHFTEAGDIAHGIAYWQKAGARARARSAHVEAIRHLTRGLKLIATKPPGNERDVEDLQFEMPLSASYIAVRGYAAPEVEEHIQRARELCERLGSSSPLFHVMMILWALRFIRGQSEPAIATSLEILALADTRDDSYKAEAHWSRTASEWWAGDFEQTLTLSRRGVSLHQIETSLMHMQILQQNCGPLMMSYTAWSYWMLGYPEQAAHWQDRAIALAEKLQDKFTLVVTQWQFGFYTALARNGPETLAVADRVIATSEEQSYAFWLALGFGLKGVALAIEGRHVEAVPLLRDGLTRCDAIGSGILHTMFLGELAESHWQIGQRPAAWEALSRALEHNDLLKQRAFEAELKRRRAMFLLDESPDNAPAAEACLREAIATARQQKARMFELRSSIALAKLLSTSGRSAEGLQLVEHLLGTFTEGASCPDLIEAREFLAIQK